MHKYGILAAAAVLAASSIACANSGGDLLPLSPSAVATAASDSGVRFGAEARGGGGGKPSGGSGGGGGTISLAMVTDNNHDTLPNFGETVTFNVSTTATAYPWVTLKCYQNGTLGSQTSNGIFPTSLGQNFKLGPSLLWTSGAADCTATLHEYGSSTALASTSFHVNP